MYIRCLYNITRKVWTKTEMASRGIFFLHIKAYKIQSHLEEHKADKASEQNETKKYISLS